VTRSDELAGPMVGRVLHRGGKQRWTQAQLHPKKTRHRGAQGFAHRGGLFGGESGRDSGEAMVSSAPKLDKRQLG
jgi:hypothetical protein